MSAANLISCVEQVASESPSSQSLFREPVFSEEVGTHSAFRSFFDNAPIGVVRCGREGTVLQMSVELERRFGELSQRKPLHLYDLVVSEDRDKAGFLLREVIEAGRDGIGLSVRPAGARHEVSNWTAWHQAGPCGEREAVLILVQPAPRDEPMLPTEDLFQARRWEALGQLTGGVAHDFNNLLTGIMLYCDLLLSSFDARDLRRRYAEEIRSAIIPASALVRQLLVFARPQQVDPCPVSFNEIAESMRDLLMRLLGENFSLELSLDPGLGLVKPSRSQAEQILLNLVLNARDAMPEGGRIRIETRNAGFRPIEGLTSERTNPPLPCVLISVTDNGRGMDAETRQRLFEPFFTTKAEKGSGLGLTTVQSIITSHRGLIHFESQPGLGTCAMILLPRAEGAEIRLSAGCRGSGQIALEIPSQDLKKESLS